MALTREQFAENLKRSTEAIRKEIARFCWNELPRGNRYFVILNASFDGNPLASGEELFPDHDLPQKDKRVPRTADEVVEKLWRAGRVPEWIDITPYEVDGDFLYSELRCCGRFSGDETFLYHQQEGYSPFHSPGPVLPVGYRDLETDGKFDLHCYRDRERIASNKATGTGPRPPSPIRIHWVIRAARFFGQLVRDRLNRLGK